MTETETSQREAQLVERALQAARDTRALVVQAGVRHQAARHFAVQFGSRAAVVVADRNTFEAAGRDVQASFDAAGHATAEAFVFGPHIYADYACVQELAAAL